jgi:putative DNA primase/helicase
MKNFVRKLKLLLVSVLAWFPAGADLRPARCCNIRTLLLHLCDMDEQLCTWVLRWLAFQLRNPGAKMTTALVINGDHFGKSMFFERVLGPMFGSSARFITADQLHDKFTRWAVAPCSLVVVTGVFAQRHLARMRAFVTAESVVVERRGALPAMRPNHLNFIFLSSSGDFLPADVGGRRFVVVEAPPAWPPRFQEAVQAEIKQGGLDAFHEYLTRDLDMGTFNESTQPPLPALQRNHQEAA